jgi:hypothetical protein
MSTSVENAEVLAGSVWEAVRTYSVSRSEDEPEALREVFDADRSAAERTPTWEQVPVELRNEFTQWLLLSTPFLLTVGAAMTQVTALMQKSMN